MTTSLDTDLLRRNVTAAKAYLDTLLPLEAPLAAAAGMLAAALRGGRKLLTCGNGGSASDASHIATEFVVRFETDRRAYPAISLNEVGSTLTAAGNDYGFDRTFARQVEAFGQAGDVLLAISTSGNSRNIIEALGAAKAGGVKTIALLGRDGGLAKGIADVELIVPGDSTARIQEAHTVVYHTLCEMVEGVIANGS